MKAILIASIAASLATAALSVVESEPVPRLPAWDEAPEDFKQGFAAQVQAYVDNPELTPAAVYGAWLDQKQADGWTFGEVLDAEKKQSPNLVPWSQAPVHQRVIETLVHACANRLKDVPDEAAVQGGRASLDTVTGRSAASAAILVAPSGYVMIQYVGRRLTHKDGNYGTGIEWSQGETKPVPATAAALMLRHTDVYALGKGIAPEQPPVAKVDDKAKEEERLQDVRDSIASMTKDACKAYAKAHFRVDLDDGRVADLRAKVVQLVDQYGVAE